LAWHVKNKQPVFILKYFKNYLKIIIIIIIIGGLIDVLLFMEGSVDDICVR
jgi:hypothetical protein